MRSRNVVWFAGVIALLALWAASASAGMISYNANADPAGETYDGYPTESGIQPWAKGDPAKTTGTGIVDTDYGNVLAWQATDGNDNGWYHYPTSADVALSESTGYTLSANLRPATSASTNYVHVVCYNDNSNHKTGWMYLRSNPAGSGDNLFIKVNDNADYVYEMVNAALGYHDYKLTVAPGATTASFLVDGTTIFSNVPLLDNSTWGLTSSYIEFGDNTGSSTTGGGTINYHSVVWSTTIPEPCAITILGTGLIGLLAYAWRKRK
jgi:hypothetical protein